jgi:hypothetical protein
VTRPVGCGTFGKALYIGYAFVFLACGWASGRGDIDGPVYLFYL